jgi:hypothetical protein
MGFRNLNDVGWHRYCFDGAIRLVGSPTTAVAFGNEWPLSNAYNLGGGQVGVNQATIRTSLPSEVLNEARIFSAYR